VLLLQTDTTEVSQSQRAREAITLCPEEAEVEEEEVDPVEEADLT